MALLSVILSHRWANSRSRLFKVMKSRKFQIKSLMFGWLDTCFYGQFFIKDAKNEPRTLFSSKNRTKFGNWKKTNSREQREKWPFSSFKLPKLVRFSRYLLEILYTYTPNRAFTYIPVLKFENVRDFFSKTIFYIDYSFKNVIFKILKIEDWG